MTNRFGKTLESLRKTLASADAGEIVQVHSPTKERAERLRILAHALAYDFEDGAERWARISFVFPGGRVDGRE